ncbi:sortase B [Lachnospiraceae bacterium XBB1006]|nr:sortase B [Lachnospiraceae bacterium XBB1006]
MRKKYIRIGMFFLCLAVFLVSSWKLTLFVKDYFQASSDYTEAEEAFSLPEEDTFPSMEENSPPPSIYDKAELFFKDCDYDALKNLNKEICGWIVIPAVNISYPILQHNDNQYYLTHLYNHTENHVGSIFMDYRVSKDFSDFNSILYGHNMRDKSMFAKLHQFQKKKTWKKNPYVYIYGGNGIKIYKIFSAFTGDADGLSYAIGLQQKKSKQEFIDYACKHAFYRTKIVPSTSDHIITLSTCSDSEHKYRMIVQGVLLKEE